jgi:hypothetical protein
MIKGTPRSGEVLGASAYKALQLGFSAFHGANFFFKENVVGALPFVIGGKIKKSLYKPGRTRQRRIRLYIQIPPLYMHGQLPAATQLTCWPAGKLRYHS